MYEINDVWVIVETSSGLQSDAIFITEWDYVTEGAKDILKFNVEPISSNRFGNYKSVSVTSAQVIVNSVFMNRLHFNPVNLGSVDSLSLHVSIEVEDLDTYKQLIF
jgi:hypothetical protein